MISSIPTYPAQTPFAVQPALPQNKPVQAVSQPANHTAKRVKAFATAGGLFTAALLLKRMPARHSAYEMIPTDWKQWAKAGLGVAGINQLNQGLEWKPPLWLGTLQTVTILTPLLQKLEKGLFRQYLILAPLITGLVQANHWVSEKVEDPLEKKFHIPPLVTQLGFSVLTTILGMKAFPPINKGVDTFLSKQGIVSSEAPTSTTVATGITCARGCCASAVCLNEIGEYGSAFMNWIKHKNTTEGKQA